MSWDRSPTPPRSTRPTSIGRSSRSQCFVSRSTLPFWVGFPQDPKIIFATALLLPMYICCSNTESRVSECGAVRDRITKWGCCVALAWTWLNLHMFILCSCDLVTPRRIANLCPSLQIIKHLKQVSSFSMQNLMIGFLVFQLLSTENFTNTQKLSEILYFHGNKLLNILVKPRQKAYSTVTKID